MHSKDQKKIQEILSDIKAAYLKARGRGGLGREDPEGVTAEIELTEWMDEELDCAFRFYLRSKLADALGIESWVRDTAE